MDEWTGSMNISRLPERPLFRRKPAGHRFLFTGKELDIHTGLYDFGARSCDVRQGQWLSPDPAFDGLNLYGYVHNNPVNLVDPSGLSAEVSRDNPIPVSDTGLREGQQFFRLAIEPSELHR